MHTQGTPLTLSYSPKLGEIHLHTLAHPCPELPGCLLSIAILSTLHTLKLLLGEDLAGLDEREELGEGWLATGLPSGSLWKKGPSYVREELELPLLGQESTPGKRKMARVSEGPTCSWPCERCWHGSWLVMAHVRCGVVGWCVLMQSMGVVHVWCCVSVHVSRGAERTFIRGGTVGGCGLVCERHGTQCMDLVSCLAYVLLFICVLSCMSFVAFGTCISFLLTLI